VELFKIGKEGIINIILTLMLMKGPDYIRRGKGREKNTAGTIWKRLVYLLDW
jgi:hypothetical protein